MRRHAYAPPTVPATALLLAASALLPGAARAQTATSGFVPVTDAMLQDPAPGDWPMWRRTLDGWGYSPLDQIDRDNVGDIRMVWSRGLAEGSNQGTPLVYDGVMYMPNPGDVIQALDAVTGDLRWEYRRDPPRRPGRPRLRAVADQPEHRHPTTRSSSTPAPTTTSSRWAHSRFPGAVCRQRWTVRLGEVEPVFGQTGRVVLDITARTAHDGALKWTRAPSTPRAARSILATFPSTCALPSGGRWSLRRVLQRPGRQRKRSSAKSSCGSSRTSSSAPSSPPCCNARCARPRLATRRAPSCATCPGGCGATAWRPSTFAPPGARRCRSPRRTTARNTPVGRSGGRDSTP